MPLSSLSAAHDQPISDDDDDFGVAGGMERWLPQPGQTSVTAEMLHERQTRRREAFGGGRAGRQTHGGVSWDAGLSARGLGDVPASGAKMAVSHRHAAAISARRRPGAPASGNATGVHPYPAANKAPVSARSARSARSASSGALPRPRSATPTRNHREGVYGVEDMAEQVRPSACPCRACASMLLLLF
eukprot:scaffold238727_cov33-Tisochrysis_lutea.AAC.1